MEPVTTLTAAAIADLAFRKFIESGAGELAKKFTETGLKKLDDLYQGIRQKLWGKPTAEAALTEIEKGNLAEKDRLTAYLQVAMDDDPQFAARIQQLAQEIHLEVIQDESSMNQQQNNYGGTNYQNQMRDGNTVFQGGEHTHHH
ncbi:MAG: hypothetical protein KME13_03105 [Myxacorys californica WJT36-NPBG1]|jgi:hypothetical protein|nr:hypothetical protein [Myxacorys californica WJT36-NPBG1]